MTSRRSDAGGECRGLAIDSSGVKALSDQTEESRGRLGMTMP
jgi:hypothetical protein